MRTVKFKISSTGKKAKVEGNTLVQYSADSYIELYTEEFYTNITCAFKGIDSKISPNYHLVYIGKVDDAKDEFVGYKYMINIPTAVLSFVMPAPTARIDVSFKLWRDDNRGYLKAITVANTTLTVNRSANSDLLDASYNSTDVNNLWDTIGKVSNQINDLLVGDIAANYTTKEQVQALQNSIPNKLIINGGYVFLGKDTATIGTGVSVPTVFPDPVIIAEPTAVSGYLLDSQMEALSGNLYTMIMRGTEYYRLEAQVQADNTNYMEYYHNGIIKKRIRINTTKTENGYSWSYEQL